MTTKIVTALRVSDSYKEEYVDLLYKQCQKYAPNSEFICISNFSNVPGYVKANHDWEKWWCKIEVFTIPGPVLFMDLDTIVLKNIDNVLKLCQNHDFLCLRDFYKTPKMERTVGSGIMGWNSDMTYLYDIFCKDPKRHIEENRTPRWHGDQGFVERYVKSYELWQDKTNEIVSWKKHCKAGIPNHASIVSFHGKPKPWDVKIKK